MHPSYPYPHPTSLMLVVPSWPCLRRRSCLPCNLSAKQPSCQLACPTAFGKIPMPSPFIPWQLAQIEPNLALPAATSPAANAEPLNKATAAESAITVFFMLTSPVKFLTQRSTQASRLNKKFKHKLIPQAWWHDSASMNSNPRHPRQTVAHKFYIPASSCFIYNPVFCYITFA